MKKISSLLCALALMVSCFSVSAYAAENNPMPEVGNGGTRCWYAVSNNG